MHTIYRGKYQKIVLQQQEKKKGWLIEGHRLLHKYYNNLTFVALVSPKLAKEDPVYCYPYDPFCFIDPDAGFKAEYTDTELETLARWHCANIKAADISQSQKRTMDFVLGVAHEIGHWKASHHHIDMATKEDFYYQQKEIEAEQEVYRVASFFGWLDIIEPTRPPQRFISNKEFIKMRTKK